jgi:hypothetical protein
VPYFDIEFHGNYFDTLTYLRYLETLPWCVIWDDLLYQVVNYPEADVKVRLHIEHA